MSTSSAAKKATDWPTTVWNNHSEPYPADEAEKTAASIKNAIEQEKSKPEYAQN